MHVVPHIGKYCIEMKFGSDQEMVIEPLQVLCLHQ